MLFIFKIYLHGPFELPQILHKKEISGSVSQFKSFSLTATTIVARKNVRSLFIKHRKCRYVKLCFRLVEITTLLGNFDEHFFSYLDESNLNHFPSFYTYDLCKLECKISAIYEKCNCIPFFYKKLPTEVYCNIAQLTCVDIHKGKLFFGNFIEKLELSFTWFFLFWIRIQNTSRTQPTLVSVSERVQMWSSAFKEQTHYTGYKVISCASNWIDRRCV